MIYTELQTKIKTPVFFDYQTARIFNKEPKNQINTQLSRLVAAGKLLRLKRGLFVFSDFARTALNEFVVASLLYTPSYISLESALSYYDLIPDIPAIVTNITSTTSKNIKSPVGTFSYSKIKQNLYFGFMAVGDVNGPFSYNIAHAEKALLDYVYIRKIRDLKELRLNASVLNTDVLKNYAKLFPARVQRVVAYLYE